MEQIWNDEGQDPSVLTDETFTAEALDATNDTFSQIIKDKYDGRYVLDTDLTTPGSVILHDRSTGKGLILLRGANSGQVEPVLDEYGRQIGEKLTESGQVTNALDESSYWSALHPLKKTKVTGELYPELAPQADRAITRYGVDNLETVSYSNGGLKAHYLNTKKGIRMTAFDPVVAPSQARDVQLRRLKAEAHYVRTTKNSPGLDGIMGSSYVRDGFSRSIMDPFSTSHPGLNTRVTTINPIDSTAMNLNPEVDGMVFGGHNIEQFSTPDAVRTKPGIVDGVVKVTKSGVKSLGAGMATSLLAGVTTSGMHLGHEGNLVATSLTNTAYDAAGAGAYALVTGAGGTGALGSAASAGGVMLLPTLAAYETTDHVGELMSKVTKNWRDRGAAAFTDGAVSSATGAVAGLDTYTATAIAVNGARSLGTAASPAAEEGLLLGTSDLGEGLLASEASSAALEGLTVAAEGAGAVTAAEETAGGIALIPIPGARVVAGLVAGGALIGGGISWVFSDHESDEEKQKKVIAKYQELSDRYIGQVKRRTLRPSASEYESYRPERYLALTKKEIEFMNAVNPTYFKQVDQNVAGLWQHEHDMYTLVDKINARRKADPFFDVGKMDAGDLHMMQMNAPEYLKDWSDVTGRNYVVLNDEAKRLGISKTELQEHYVRIANGIGNGAPTSSRSETQEDREAIRTGPKVPEELERIGSEAPVTTSGSEDPVTTGGRSTNEYGLNATQYKTYMDETKAGVQSVVFKPFGSDKVVRMSALEYARQYSPKDEHKYTEEELRTMK